MKLLPSRWSNQRSDQKLFRLAHPSTFLCLLIVSWSGAATGQVRIPVPNGDAETDADGDLVPDGFVNWNRANTRAEFQWDDVVFQTQDDTETGHSLRLEITGVESATGLSSIYSSLTGVVPGRLYHFSAAVRTDHLSRAPSIAIRWKRADGTEWVSDSISELGVHGTNDWRTIEVWAEAPERADTIVLFGLIDATDASLGGSAWFDDFELWEYDGPAKRISLHTVDTVYLSETFAAQVPIRPRIMESVGNTQCDFVVELPCGVWLSAMKWADVPEPSWLCRDADDQEIVCPETVAADCRLDGEVNAFQRYVVPKPWVTDYYAAEILLLETDWNTAESGKMALYATWPAGDGFEAGSQPPVFIALEVVPPVDAQPLDRLAINAPNWWGLHTQRRFPDYVSTLREVGTSSLPLINALFALDDESSDDDAMVDEAETAGLDISATFSPFFSRSSGTVFEPHELAADAQGNLSDHMCPTLRSGGFLNELNLIARAGAIGASWVFFDFEGNGYDVFCGDGIERWFDFSGLEMLEKNDPSVFGDDDIFDWRDALFREFVAGVGTELWTATADAIDTAHHEAGFDARLAMSNWRAQPGANYNGLTELDRLYPQVFDAAMPVIYPHYDVYSPVGLAVRIRRNLLGVLSDVSENLVANSGFEDGEGDWPDGVIVEGSGASWIDLDSGDGWVAHGLRALQLTGGEAEATVMVPAPPAETPFLAGVTARRIGFDVMACIELTWLDGSRDPVGDSSTDCGPDVSQTGFRITAADRVPSEAEWAQMRLFSTGTEGDVWFDDLRVGTPTLLGQNSPPEAEGGGRHVWPAVPVFAGVSYQLSVSMRSSLASMPQEFGVVWMDSDALPIEETARMVDMPLPQDWAQLSVSAEAPAEAVSARVFVSTEEVDHIDFRVDGPYVIPWITGGWNSYNEFPNREVLEQLVISMVSGAQAVTSWPASGYDAADMTQIARATRILSPFEVLLSEGTPVPQNRLSSGDDTLALGITWDGDGLVLVVAAEDELGTDLTYHSDYPGTAWRVALDGAMASVAEVGDGVYRLPVEIDAPAPHMPRFALFFFERDRNPPTTPADPNPRADRDRDAGGMDIDLHEDVADAAVAEPVENDTGLEPPDQALFAEDLGGEADTESGGDSASGCHCQAVRTTSSLGWLLGLGVCLLGFRRKPLLAIEVEK